MKEPNRKSWKGQLYASYWDRAAQEVDPHVDQLAHSQLMRKLILEDFDYLPSSIWPYDPTANFPDPLAEGRNTLKATDAESGDLYGKQKEEGGGRLSVFEGRLARNLVRLYSNPGDLVLDPFAGRGARLAASLDLSRHYRGFDLSPQAVEACRQVAGESWKSEALVWQENSLAQRDYLPAESADLVLTCPPYGWSEFYGDNGSGLEAAPDYLAFIEELAAVLLLSVESLKPERYLVLVIRGWFMHRHYYDVAAHLERYLAAAGLTCHAHDVHKMSTSRERFHSDVVNWRRSAQVHEDVLVWQKAKVKRTGTAGYNRRTLEGNTRRSRNEARLAQERVKVLQRLLPVDPLACRPYVTQERP